MQDKERRASCLQTNTNDYGAVGTGLAPREDANCWSVDGRRRIRLPRHAPPENESRNGTEPRVLHNPTTALRKSRKAHTGSGKGTTRAAKHATHLIPRTCGVAQPENTRLEELLRHAVQRKVDGKARLVHPDAADEMVRKEAPAKELAQFRI